MEDLIEQLEAVIFAAGEPIELAALQRIFVRSGGEAIAEQLEPALSELKVRWQQQGHGFELVEVAGGYAFRTKTAHTDVLRAMREDKPFKLSRSAMETLAIIAYKQPVTKPEADFIRGVDCGGTLKVLLDRNLIQIVGRKEDVGRPLLYGTTKDFLSVFNLVGLDQLPALRDVKELTEEPLAEAFTIQDLSEAAAALQFSDEPMVEALDKAVEELASTDARTQHALLQEGIILTTDKEAQVKAATTAA
jgi:segregation and condensation protein B